ncbi:pre-peptidase C-terminal domain-containing protein [Archangium violaceum]|uniref:endonuclease/exonuclease/phosphatase family protein n=1 Tax=Archangium violaceum TaxID=83451 RepID=UPI0019505531|nr:endonuclease/exonuclease/phosphatase family protein [Archangium violaceum]QRN95053.1 pre-peptidase C-terminal domain-containing protein [Archangium violaceum]
MRHSPTFSTRTGRWSWLLAPLLTLALAACGGSAVDSREPVDEGVSTSEAPLADVRVRLMAANITSGNGQSYGSEGIRIFQGTRPDVVMLQEFNYQDNSAAALRSFVDTAFGTGFYYSRETGAQIPNGVISRWPILASGQWNDPVVSNRDFAWARIDAPGSKDLWVVSVHLLNSGTSGDRNNEAIELVKRINELVPAGDYLAIGGDFNTDSRSESCFTTFEQVVTTSGPHPVDQKGDPDTNANRNKPYDHVLVDLDLRAYQTPTVLGSSSFTAGVVVDTRVYTPLSDISPAQFGDSGSTNMQHMAVIKDFLIPADTTTPTASVTVVAPNGGESWTGGLSGTITWTASNVTNVKLEYTLDGSTWNVITASTPASAGSYSWTVPGTATTVAKVRVSDTANVATSDTSDAAFTITDPGPTPDPVITQETEANNTAAGANGRVAAGTNVTGSVSTSTDIDWFKFTVTGPGLVTVKLTMPGTGDLDWYLYSGSNVSTYLTRGYTTANPEVGTYSVPAAGTYYVKVVGYAGATSNYTLNVSGTAVQP